MMNKILKVAIIGLDTSHSTAFASFMLDPETRPEFKIDSMLPTRCLRFETPFQDAEGLDKRQAIMESLGVEVGTDFDWAVADCDAIMMNINDPSYHVEYFEKCAKLGKPIYIDKPVAGTVADTRKIYELAEKYHLPIVSHTGGCEEARSIHLYNAAKMHPDIDFETCDTLIDDQILDSIDIVSLVAEISDVFDVAIPAEELLPENFNSAKALYALVERLMED